MISRTARAPTIRLITTAAALACVSTANGQFGPASQDTQQGPPSGDELVSVRAAADVDAIEPGESFHLAYIFEVEPDWHTYWLNPGVSGLPMDIDVDAPDGFEVGEIRWPRPQAIREPQGVAFGYKDTVVLFVPVTAPGELPSGSARFDASAEWLVCKEVCLMGRGTASVSVPVDPSSADARAESDRKLISQFKDRLPIPIDSMAGEAEAKYDGRTLTVTGPAGDADTAEFFPIEKPGVQYADADVDIRNGRFTVTVPVEWDPNNAMGNSFEILGVVGLGDEPDQPAVSVHLTPDA